MLLYSNSIKVFKGSRYISEVEFELLFNHLRSVMFDYVVDKKEKKVLVCAVFDNKHPLYFQMHIKSFLCVCKRYSSYFREVKWICQSDYTWRYK